MLLHTIFAPLWQPMKDQLSLFRALATGGRIPGTNLILMPVASERSRFGVMEHFMMALAGAWLLFRVICSELAFDDMQPKKRQRPSLPWYRESDTDTDMETDADADTDTDTTSCCTNSDIMAKESEEIFYWGCHHKLVEKPVIRFSRAQLDHLLRLDSDEEYYDDDDSDYEYEDEDIDDSDVKGREQDQEQFDIKIKESNSAENRIYKKFTK